MDVRSRCQIRTQGMKIISKEERIIELQHAPKKASFEIEFDYFEFDPVDMSESFFSRWNKYWMRDDPIDPDFYTT